jgi:polar amino acid transport system substrate-binding protein
MLVGLCLATVLALWRWEASRDQDAVWEQIQARGELRVGMDASFPPFEIVTASGEFAGYDVELAKELGRRWGLVVVFVNIHFDGLYDALLDGKCDLILSALPYDRDLTQDVAYSASYLNVGQVLVTRQAAKELGEKGALKGKQVAVELGSEGHFVALELNRQKLGIEILAAYTSEEAMQMLRSGRAEALILDRVSALVYARQYGELWIHPTPLSNEPYVIAVPYSSPRLLRQVNQTLETLRQEGLLDKLVEEWIR